MRLAVTIAGQSVSALEMVAFASGLASVWLAARLHAATWPSGLLSVLCYAFVFVEAKLYADALLQLVFAALCVVGWRAWLAGSRPATALTVTIASRREFTTAAALSVAGVAIVALILWSATDSPVPLLDASIFVLSAIAVYAQARKKLESWWLWICVDVISVPLYLARGLPLTAALYAIFLVLCLIGLRAWRAELAPAASSTT